MSGCQSRSEDAVLTQCTSSEGTARKSQIPNLHNDSVQVTVGFLFFFPFPPKTLRALTGCFLLSIPANRVKGRLAEQVKWHGLGTAHHITSTSFFLFQLPRKVLFHWVNNQIYFIAFIVCLSEEISK